MKADFEAAATSVEGIECWFARDLQKLLGYSKWENFVKVVGKAKSACEQSGEEVANHFPDVRKMVEIGSGTEREIADIALTRYACYLIAQNGDPRKEEIAFAQSYFAVQTRKVELIEERVKLNARIRARTKLARSEKELSKLIYERGVDQQGFARIRSRGDAVLFGGNSTQQMKLKLGMPNNRPLADFLPTLTITAKQLATEITNYNVQVKDLHGEDPITQEHVASNKDIREALLKRGIKPEDLPPEEDIKKLQRRVNATDKKLLGKKGKKG